MITIIVFLSLLLLIASYNYHLYHHERNGEWHFYDTIYTRRYIHGEWQYRLMTDDEAEEYSTLRSW